MLHSIPARAFRVLAVNDSRDFCECCGRKGLKRVVWVVDDETGDHHHFGTTCALDPAKGFDKGLVQKALRGFEDAQKLAWRGAHAQYRTMGHGYRTIDRWTFKANRPEILQGLFDAAWAELRKGMGGN